VFDTRFAVNLEIGGVQNSGVFQFDREGNLEHNRSGLDIGRRGFVVDGQGPEVSSAQNPRCLNPVIGKPAAGLSVQPYYGGDGAWCLLPLCECSRTCEQSDSGPHCSLCNGG
jgi:hypothetical protein